MLSRRIHYGYTASADADLTAVRMLRITDIQDNGVNWSTVPGCIIDDNVVAQYELERGDILIARTGGTIGKTFLMRDVPVRAVFASYLIRIQGTKHVFDEYLKLFLESPLYWTQLRDGTRGTGQPNVNGQTLGMLIISLPPLAEQRRIVAKVDELMALCDRLEAARAEREATRDRLTASTLARLNTPDPVTFQADARFALNTLHPLTTRSDQIKQLRQTILNLAVCGKLVPQNSKDEPASEVLKRIAKERAQLPRHDRSLAIISPEEFPMKVPTGWALCRLIRISRRIHYGYTASADADLKEVRMLRITDIQDNGVNWSTVPGCVIDDNTVAQYELEKGDILVARTGGTIGKTFLMRDVPVRAVFASYLIRIQAARHVFDEYLKLFLESPLYWTQLRDGTRGTGQPNVNGQTLGKLVISLPPLPEQHRIVKKVDELMAICGQLESNLDLTGTTRRKLLDALLAVALAPSKINNLEAAE